MKGALKIWIEQHLMKGQPPSKLAGSFAIGIFIAFSPYLGVQTILIFLLGFLLKLNKKIIFTIVYVINNPWTMFPIVGLDYMVGVYISKSILNIDLSLYNPSWMMSFNVWLNNKVGYYVSQYMDVQKLSFWTYMLGGHVLAIFLAIPAYFIANYVFKKMHKELQSKPYLEHKIKSKDKASDSSVPKF
jgi:uncharacterized protein